MRAIALVIVANSAGVFGCGADTPTQKPVVEYRRSMWLRGLGEEVTIVKTPTSVHVERSGRSVAPYAWLLHEDAARYWQRYGAASLALHERAATSADETLLQVAVVFDVPDLELLIQQTEGDRNERIAAVIAQAGEPVAAALVDQGFVERRRSQGMPALYGSLPAGALSDVAYDPRIRSITLDEPALGAGEYTASDPVVEHAIDSTWNTCGSCGSGNYGAEVAVGMIEWCGYDPDVGARGIYDDHGAFDDLSSLDYAETPLATCTEDDECQGSQTNGCERVRCIGGICISEHASEVASVIAASKGGTASGAAKIKLLLSNLDKPNTTAGYDKTYNYLKNKNVLTVNETHAGINGFDGPQVADYYAHTFDMLPVQAAGNNSTFACVQSANALCVGGTTERTALAMASYSNVANPTSYPDREEPDVTAFGGDALSQSGILAKVLGFSSASDWSGENDGTSFAVPAVTSMVAHVRNECAPYFGTKMAPALLRAIFRTAAWSGNPHGELYSTPSNAWDWEDGGGWVDAPALDWFCQAPGGNNGGAGVVTIDLLDGRDPYDGTTTIYTPGFPHEQRQPLDYHEPSDIEFGRKEYVLAEATLQVGDRVRFTISYDVCGNDPMATSSVGVDIDLDLYLYNSSTKTYVYGSQSLHDNNEGFDVTITENDESGDYEVIISRPKEQTQHCGASEMSVWWAGRWGTW